MKKRLLISVVLLASILGALPLCAQESCYAEYLREHNMRVLTAEDADDSYDELKKAVLAWQLYGSEASLPLRPKEEPAAPKQQDTTCVIVHLALVDSTWYMWMSVDPLADKYPGNTPYSYCNGNPIMLVDPDGREPSGEEAAWMAEYAYGGDETYLMEIKKTLEKTGWRIVSSSKELINGYQATLFERTIDGVTEYAYAFAGTDPTSIADLAADIGQVFGLSSQYYIAIQKARQLSNELGCLELTFVGHSLGGGEATAASLATGRSAITFNPAAVSYKTILGGSLYHQSKIVNYVSEGDPLTKYQMICNPILSLKLHSPLLILPGQTFSVPTITNSAHKMSNFLNITLPK